MLTQEQLLEIQSRTLTYLKSKVQVPIKQEIKFEDILKEERQVYPSWMIWVIVLSIAVIWFFAFGRVAG